MTRRDEEAPSTGAEQGIVLSGTGGVWRVRREDGSVVEASLRGRVKKSNAGRRADGSLRRDTVASAPYTPVSHATVTTGLQPYRRVADVPV